MRMFWENAKGWILTAAILAAIPIPLMGIWIIIDRSKYSWPETLKLAGFTYAFEAISLVIYMMRPDDDDT